MNKIIAALAATASLAFVGQAEAYQNIDNGNQYCARYLQSNATLNLHWQGFAGPAVYLGYRSYNRHGDNDVTYVDMIWISTGNYWTSHNPEVVHYASDEFSCRVKGPNSAMYIYTISDHGVAWRP
jgi:hypothetical protein